MPLLNKLLPMLKLSLRKPKKQLHLRQLMPLQLP